MPPFPSPASHAGRAFYLERLYEHGADPAARERSAEYTLGWFVGAVERESLDLNFDAELQAVDAWSRTRDVAYLDHFIDLLESRP